MGENVETISANIQSEAAAQGLVVFPSVPGIADISMLVDWPGDWRSYLHLAVQAHVTILYVASADYDPAREVRSAIRGLGYADADELAGPFGELSEELQWMIQRVTDRVSKWDGRIGETASLLSIWFCDGVAHGFEATAEWYDQATEEIRSVAEEAHSVLRENWRIRSAEEAKRLLECAKEMAMNERFPEAKSEAKRRFMAEQLFPSEDTTDSRRIADLAALYHWWHVEPTQRVPIAQKACDLYDSGETIQSISLMLSVPQTRVRKAIESAAAERPR